MLVSGGSCLPHGLSGTYTDYKRTTNIAIKWLQDNGTDFQAGDDPKVVTCSGLLRLAESIRLKGLEAPREIIVALRDAIDGRKHLNKWMRDHDAQSGLVDAESNKRHEIFTKTLETILDGLRVVGSSKLRAAAIVRCTSSISSSSSSSSPEPLLNRYEALYSSEPESDNEPETPKRGGQAASAVSPPTAMENIKSVSPETDLGLEFDVMMDDMITWHAELFVALGHLDALLSIARSTWAKAGRGDIPYNVASALTRAIGSSAYNDLRKISACPWSYDQNLWKMAIRTLKIAGLPPGWERTDMPPISACLYGDGMLLPFHVLNWYESKQSLPKIMPVFGDALSKISATSNRDTDARAMLLLLQCMLSHEISKDYDHEATPGIVMAQKWAQDAGYHRVELAFYLRLLLECHRAYMFPHGAMATQPSRPVSTPLNPRIRLLKYVMKLRQNFTDVANNPYMQHCCESALAGDLTSFASDMDVLAHEPHYNLYSQNPFVVGDIMLNLNSLVSGMSKEICNHRHYVASILHVYNALRCMGDIEQPIPVLDELCSIFEDIIFLGARPLRNFASIFVRHRGGLPQYGYTSEYAGHNKGSNSLWSMRLPSQDIGNDNREHHETNYHRFKETIDQSLFMKTTDGGALGYNWYWAKAVGLQNWQMPTETDMERVTSWLQSHTLNNHPLSYVEDRLAAEYNGLSLPSVELPTTPSIQSLSKGSTCVNPNSEFFRKSGCSHRYCVQRLPVTPGIRFSPFEETCGCTKNLAKTQVAARERVRGTGLLPVHRLNILMVWKTCANIFGQVRADSKHKAADGTGDTEIDDPISCLCLVDHLLEDADVWLNRSKKSMKYPGKKLKKKWIEAIEGGFREVPVEEFLWKWL